MRWPAAATDSDASTMRSSSSTQSPLASATESTSLARALHERDRAIERRANVAHRVVHPLRLGRAAIRELANLTSDYGEAAPVLPARAASTAALSASSPV